MLEINNEIKYRQFTIFPKKGHPVRVMSASVLLPDGQFAYGFAYCSHKDQFSRKEGKEKALERLMNDFDQEDTNLFTFTIGPNIEFFPRVAMLKSLIVFDTTFRGMKCGKGLTTLGII